MALWSLNTPPKFKNPKGKPCVATKRGWEDPDTGEVLVAISSLTLKAGAADILEVTFDAASYARTDAVSVTVRFNERVDVTAGAAIEISWSGVAGNFFAHALAQTNVHEVVFNKDPGLVSNALVPNEAGDLSVAAQSVSGTINDAGTLITSNNAVSLAAAAAAGTIVVS